MRRPALLTIVLAACCGAVGCSAQLGPVRCASADNCAPGTYCSVAGQCAAPAQCTGDPGAACAVTAPTGLAAVGEQHQVSLSWSTVGGATSYVVRRAIQSGGPYSEAATLPEAGLVDQGLSAATGYYYLVHAVGPGGAGADSAEVSGLTVPDPPAHLTATASTGAITLGWDPAPGVTGYRITRAGSDGVFARLADTGATPTSYVDSGLAFGATWSYAVLSLNASGASAASPIASATAQ